MERTQLKSILVNIDMWENEFYEMKVMEFFPYFLVFYDLKVKKKPESFWEVKKFLEGVYNYYSGGLKKPILCVRKGKTYLLSKEDNKVIIQEIKEGDEEWQQLLPL